ncbi:MAG: chemotaxis protein CheA, partial [Bacteroidota bacterium]|nr:chemotaxis protein CheA [Bacteroidota bacterium]
IKEAVSIRVDSNKIDELINIVSELVTVQARLNLLSENSVDSELKDVSEAIEKITRNLRNNAFEISLVAIKSIKIRFSRLVRDLSMELNKNIVFETKGDETELDKSIVEKLTDPLLHIFRNCIDHGIESEKERLAAGKPAVGTILMNSYYSGSEVHIRIQDDGRGIDPDKIKQKAIDKAVIAKNTDLSKHQIFDLLFIPGFSTAKTVSDVSGRGVGMDVVKKKVSQLRGVVDIDSELGKGTSITIKLPLTLSIIDGLLVSIDNIHYILPMSYVDKIYPVTKKAINESYNNIIVFDGEQIPFLYLRDEFGYPDNCSEFQQAVVVIYEKKKIALIVDNVDREFQAVIKSLGEHYKNQQYFSGASILGDGSIALILDTNKIIEEFTS